MWDAVYHTVGVLHSYMVLLIYMIFFSLRSHFIFGYFEGRILTWSAAIHLAVTLSAKILYHRLLQCTSWVCHSSIFL
ncbi:hypothetical protein V1521DRAFT_89942 [Lipomyces starkeyi]